MEFDSLMNLVVIEVISANRLLTSPVRVKTTRKKRERWAIILKREGRTIYTSGDQEIISDKLHPVILPKGCSYCWECIEPGSCITIEFDADSESVELLSFTISDNSSIINGFTKIESCMTLKQNGYKLRALYEIYGILLFLSKSKIKQYLPQNKKSILEPAIKFMRDNYMQNKITNDILAQLCGISTVYFRKTFEAVYGMSPIKYLETLRINKAKSILESDYESVCQVSESVGYSSIYHFSKMFKKHTGITPSEYAKNSHPKT